MTSEKFIDNVLASINLMIKQYSQGRNGPTVIGAQLDKLDLTEDQREKVLSILKMAVGEATHNIISGIEGAVSLGSSQEAYKLFDSQGNELTGGLNELLYAKLEAQI